MTETSEEIWYDLSKETKIVVTDLLRGDTVYLKGEEDIDNNVEDDVVITEEEVDGTNTADEVGQSLSQGAASTRRSSALLRSVVLVVTP